MQSVINAAAVLALLGVVLLLFANSALLRSVRELQAGMAELHAATGASFRTPGPLTLPEFATADGRHTAVLIVDAGCPACRARADDLAEIHLRSDSGDRLLALTKDTTCAAWFHGTGIDVRTDSDLLGRLAVGVTPTLLRFDPDGTEQWRRVIGARPDLPPLLGPGITADDPPPALTSDAAADHRKADR